MYKGEPPCEECDKPELLPENYQAWQLWNLASLHGRPPSFSGIHPISHSELISICETHDVGKEIYDKILIIESVELPLIRKKQEDEAEKRKKHLAAKRPPTTRGRRSFTPKRPIRRR